MASEKNPSEMTDAELNAAVAVEVMGWKGGYETTRLHDPNGDAILCGEDYPASAVAEQIKKVPLPYATSIADAWEVVEKMRDMGWHIDLDTILGSESEPYSVSFTRKSDVWQEAQRSEAATAPRAICLAALEAKGKA